MFFFFFNLTQEKKKMSSLNTHFFNALIKSTIFTCMSVYNFKFTDLIGCEYLVRFPVNLTRDNSVCWQSCRRSQICTDCNSRMTHQDDVMKSLISNSTGNAQRIALADLRLFFVLLIYLGHSKFNRFEIISEFRVHRISVCSENKWNTYYFSRTRFSLLWRFVASG